MLLNDKEIQELGLIGDPVEDHHQPGGYDVTIGEIVNADGDLIESNDFPIRPQGIVWVVSKETIKLPDDVVSYATIRTHLTNEGLLALNIGIVDPLWHGPVSTALINFGQRTIRIKKGEKFLRLTFHKINASPRAEKVVKERGEYISETQDRANKFFGESFLNISNYIEREQRKAFNRNLGFFGVILTSIGIFFGAVVSLVTIGMTYFITKDPSKDISQALADSDRIAQYLLMRSGGDKYSDHELASLLMSMEDVVIEFECKKAFDEETSSFDENELVVAKLGDCGKEGVE